MKKTLLILLALSTKIAVAQSDLNLFGKVTDKTTGEELIGASVYVYETNNGTITDFDGNYVISNLQAGVQKIICQYISYQNDTVEVNLTTDTELNFVLTQDSYTLGDINLVTRVNRKEEAYVVNVQKKAAGMINTLSKKQMSITGSSNAADAVKNVSGVNVQGGKYVYVRGLSDRYSLATLNGIALPSLDPNKNSVQMDLIPSNVIDNILVFKTFTPDLPGDFTGGMVDVYTSDFPDSLEFNVGYSAAYAQQSNLNENFIGQEKSSSDWLGYDDGMRDIPDFVKQNGINFYNPSSFESAYEYAKQQDDEVAAMTLNEFKKSSDRWTWLEKSRIQLNDSLSLATQSFSNTWDPKTFKSGINQSFSLSLGNKYEVSEKQVGFNTGISYKKKYSFYENAEIGRYKQTGETSEKLSLQKTGLESRGDENIFGSVFANASIYFNDNHKLKILGMLNQNGKSSARYFDGRNLSDDVTNGNEEQRTQRYLERRLKTMQISGDHDFEGAKKSELKWNFGITKSYQNTPDLKVFTNSYQYLEVEDEETGDFYLDTVPSYEINPSLYPGPTRYYRFLDEDNINLKTDYKFNLNDEEYIKIGGAYLDKERTNEEYRYTFNANGVSYNNDLDEYFSDQNMIVGQSKNGRGGSANYINVTDNTEVKNKYTANQKVMSSYAMAKLKPMEILEFTFGLRYENTEITAVSADTNQQKGQLDNQDFLPAFNAKYNLDESNQIRFSYGRTLARPSFVEIAPTSWFDFETGFQFVGNPKLERTLINNFDLRWEKYLTGSGLVSISGFYKEFENPIEQVMNPQAQNVELSWRNVDEAIVLGVELEFKKKFVIDEGESLNIGFNTSIIHSETKIDSLELELIRAFDPEHSDSRPMFGQSPYIVNFYSQYEKSGWNIAANFNVSGENIVIVQKGAVDVYAAPKPKLNLKVAKEISDKIKLSLSASNLLSSKDMWYYPYKDKNYTFRSYLRKPVFSVSFQVSL